MINTKLVQKVIVITVNQQNIIAITRVRNYITAQILLFYTIINYEITQIVLSQELAKWNTIVLTLFYAHVLYNN